MVSEVLLFPFGGNSKEALSIIRDINKKKPTYKILGFIDDDPKKKGKEFGGVSVIGGKEVMADYPQAKVLAVQGSPSSFLERKKSLRKFDSNRFISIVHPTAVIGEGVELGKNNLIMAGVVLTASIKLGDHLIILPNTVISHDVAIKDFSMIGSNVSISGYSTVGSNCYIGSGSKIINGINIGNNSLVGLGSVVIKDVDSSRIVAGNPAKNLDQGRSKYEGSFC